MLQYSLYRAINTQLTRLGIEYSAQDQAPQTFEDLRRECTARRVIVWNGASELTVYGDPKVNHMFRAWHDALHLKLNAPFNPDGERLVARVQCAAVNSTAIESILNAEIVGQLEYQIKHGAFPVNQIEFIKQYTMEGYNKHD